MENTNRRATDRCATLAHRDRDQGGDRAKPFSPDTKYEMTIHEPYIKIRPK